MSGRKNYKQFHSLGGKFIDATNWNTDMDLPYLYKHHGWEGVMAFGNFIHDDLNASGLGIQEGDIYVDLGANIGMSALVAEHRKASKIYCVEPDVDCFEVLKKNSGSNWILDNIAISDRPGLIPVAKWPESNQLRLSYAITLDQYVEQYSFDKIDYIKIDIEGHEKQIIHTIRDSTWRKIRKMFIEYHEESTSSQSEKHEKRFKFLTILAEKGFTEYTIYIREHQSFFYVWKE